MSRIQPYPPNISFISNLLKNFQNSFNESDSSCYSILSPSMPRETISDSSELYLLFLTFYARATIDSDPPR